jgi:HK97 family phage prohead protease
MERRFLKTEIRSRAAGEISGHAAVFYDGTPATEYRLGIESRDAVERIMPGAFDKALTDQENDVIALFNHEQNQLLGRQSSGTLGLTTDGKGLEYRIRAGDTTVAKDVREHIRRGDVTGSSFAFIPHEGGESWKREGDKLVRSITSVALFDVGPVVQPAYAGTDAQARAVGDVNDARRSLENFLKGRGNEHAKDIQQLASPTAPQAQITDNVVITTTDSTGGVVFYNQETSTLNDPTPSLEPPEELYQRVAMVQSVENLKKRQKEKPNITGTLTRIQSRKCGEQHLGMWAIDNMWFQEALMAFKAGAIPAVSLDVEEVKDLVVDDGIARISILGQMTKRGSSYGGCSTLAVRRQLEAAVNQRDVNGIMLEVESPGGTVAGVAELAAAVRAAKRHKPVHAHIEDLGASAAYWVASQADRCTANEAGYVGSIGVFSVVEDVSGQFEKNGIRVNVVSSGNFKGKLVEGLKVTDEQLEELQRHVGETQEAFLKAVSRGRARSVEEVKGWADGKIYLAKRAAEMGLIDQVESLDASMQALRVHAEEVKRRRDNAEEKASRLRELNI